MTDIYDDIQKWLSQPDNDSVEKRAKFLIKINRQVYNFVRSECSEQGEQERQGIANILEAVEDYRTDMFVDNRRQFALREKEI